MDAANFYKNLEPNLTFDKTVKTAATSDEVIKEIIKVVNEQKNSPFVLQVVKSLSYGNPDEKTFLKRVFDYACHAVKYQMDPQGHEIIFTPKLLIKHGEGDCKKFSTFISSVLMAKGIIPVLRVCSYAGEDWEHIYVIVPDGKNYIILDPVNKCQYNKEVKFKFCKNYYLNGDKSKIIPMNKLSQMGNLDTPSGGLLSGLALSADVLMRDMAMDKNHYQKQLKKHCRCHHTHKHIEANAEHFAMRGEELEEAGMHGIGKKHKVHRTKAERKARRKNFFKKLSHAGAKLAMAPNRAAFLGLVLLGKALMHSPLKINLAHKLALAYSTHAQHINDFWQKFGGDPKILKKTILKGSGVNMAGLSIASYEFDFNDHAPLPGSGMSGIGFYTAAAAAAAVTAASPIVIALTKLLKQHKIIDPADANNIESGVTQVADAAPEAQGIVSKVQSLVDDQGNIHPEVANNPIINSGAQQRDAGHEIITDPSSPAAQEQKQEAAKAPDNTEDDGSGAINKNIKLKRDPLNVDEKPQAASMLLWQPLAINTWFKASFLTSAYATSNPSYIAQIAFLIAFSGLALVSTHKLIKRFKKQKPCTN
jgi:hypothetical protein